MALQQRSSHIPPGAHGGYRRRRHQGSLQVKRRTLRSTFPCGSSLFTLRVTRLQEREQRRRRPLVPRRHIPVSRCPQRALHSSHVSRADSTRDAACSVEAPGSGFEKGQIIAVEAEGLLAPASPSPPHGSPSPSRPSPPADCTPAFSGLVAYPTCITVIDGGSSYREGRTVIIIAAFSSTSRSLLCRFHRQPDITPLVPANQPPAASHCHRS